MVSAVGLAPVRGHIEKLDFLRSVAVLSVLISHVLRFFQFTSFGPISLLLLGHWGVLIFFVHTSFVLMLSMDRHLSFTPDVPLFFSFYVRRLFRIYPLSILIVVLVVAFHLPVGQMRSSVFVPAELNASGVISNLFLVQNFAHVDSVLAPLWSLPYEIDMYLFLPFLFVLARRWRSPLPFVALFAVAVIAGRYSYVIERHGFPAFLVYVPCFLAGVIAFQFLKWPVWTLPWWVWPLGIAVLSAFYLLHPGLKHGWFSCLGLGLLLPQCREISRPSMSRVFALVAKYSYGIYLSHFIFLWLAFRQFSDLSILLQLLVFLAGTAFASVVLYHTIEHPMIRLGQRVSQSWKAKPTVCQTASAS